MRRIEREEIYDERRKKIKGVTREKGWGNEKGEKGSERGNKVWMEKMGNFEDRDTEEMGKKDIGRSRGRFDIK